MVYYAYMVECADGTYYTGFTDDVAQRVRKHNQGKGARYTRSRTPVSVIAQWEFATKSEAMSFEWHVKQLSRPQKQRLLEERRQSGIS